MSLVLFLTAVLAVWSPLGCSSQVTLQNVSIEPPQGWRKVSSTEYIMITRDGAFAQYILIQKRHVDKPFTNTKKMLRRDMLPQQAAEVIMDEIRSDAHIFDPQVIENLPSKINQYDGFRIVFTYKSKYGTEYRTMYYGFLQGRWLYSLRYSALESKYSDEDVRAFEKVMGSLKIE